MYTPFWIGLPTRKIWAFRVLNPRQWSFAKQSSLTAENGGPKVPKQTEAKRDDIVNLQHYNFN